MQQGRGSPPKSLRGTGLRVKKLLRWRGFWTRPFGAIHARRASVRRLARTSQRRLPARILKGGNMTEAAASTIETFDILRLLKSLPHRYPFLMVDRVIEARGDESGIGIKNVSINEPQFQGHFPERPVMPGVLLIEGMAQTAGVMCVNAHRPGQKPPLVYFMTIDKAKFRKPV